MLTSLKVTLLRSSIQDYVYLCALHAVKCLKIILGYSVACRENVHGILEKNLFKNVYPQLKNLVSDQIF